MSPQFKLKDKRKTKISESEENLKNSYIELSHKSNQLISLMHELAKGTTLSKFYELTCEYAIKIFSIESAAIYLPDDEKKNLEAVCSRFANTEIGDRLNSVQIFNKLSIKSDYPVAKAYRNAKSVVVESVIPPALARLGVKQGILFPIIVKDNAFGVLALRWGEDYKVSQEDIRLGELLALHLAVKIINFQLLQSARSEKDKLEILQNSIRDGLSLHGPDGVIYYANDAVSKLFGTTKSTVGVKREDLIKDWDKYHKYPITRFFDGKFMTRTVYEDLRPFLGGLMRVESTPPRYVDANYYPIIRNKVLTGMAAVYHDVTNEKEQEEQIILQMGNLRTEKDRWKAVFQSVDEGVCLLDKDLNILHMNSTCEIVSGWGFKEAIGRPNWEVFGCHTKEGLVYPDFEPLKKVIATGEAIYDEHLHTSLSGEETWVGVSASPIRSAEGELEEVVLVIRDMSTFKEVEKAKSEFVSIASHELRTPLTVINGYLSLLLNGDIGDFASESSRVSLKNILKKVYGETSRLTKLVSDLLNVSRIEENRIQLDLRKVRIMSLIAEVVEEFKGIAKEKGITLEFQPKDMSHIDVMADRNKIMQVLFNLIDNALKFTPDRGVVRVICWEEKGKIFIEVSDTGIGIPKKLQPIIFEKFQQVPGSYLKENRGTGLGLFIVKSLVELHQGQLEVESNQSKGSKFIFNLPVANS